MRIEAKTSFVDMKTGTSFIPGSKYDVPDARAERFIATGIAVPETEPTEPAAEQPRRTPRGKRLGDAPENKAAAELAE